MCLNINLYIRYNKNRNSYNEGKIELNCNYITKRFGRVYFDDEEKDMECNIIDYRGKEGRL